MYEHLGLFIYTETMTVDNNENMNPPSTPTGAHTETVASNEVGENSSQGSSAVPSHDTQSKQEKELWYQKRQKQKLEKEYAAKMADLESKIASGELKPTDEDVAEALQEKDVHVKTLEAKAFALENPLYKDHAQKIQEAVANPKYMNLSVEEVAKLVVADELLAATKESQLANTHDTGTGISARGAHKITIDPAKLPRKDFELYTQQVMSGQI